MPYFLCKLTHAGPHSPDMSEAVRVATLAHQDYWLPYLNAGLVIVTGPVDDPSGAYRVMIAHAPSRRMLEDWQADDPAMLCGLDFRFDNYAMPSAHVAPSEPLAPVSSISP